MFIDSKKNSQTKSFFSELNEGFSNSWIFNVPIDLSLIKFQALMIKRSIL